MDKKIIFFHMNQLGDLLFSFPVLKAARKSGVKTVSIVKPSLAPLLISSGLADEIIPKEKSILKMIRNIKREKSGKAVLFSESPSSVLTAYLSGIKERTGFESASLSFLLTKKAKRKGVPSLFNDKELGLAAGFEDIQNDYAGIIKIPQENINNIKKWLAQNNLNSEKTIAISIGASKKRRDKCLPANTWAEIIDSLNKLGYGCVLTGAPWEKESMAAVSGKCVSKPALFTAENGILESAAFFYLSSLFIGIDSGAMHLAAASGTKCIGIFTYTDPEQIGPMPLEKHEIIKNGNASEIKSSEIVDAAIKYLNTKS